MIGSHLSKTGLKTLNPLTKLLLIQTFLQKRSVPKKSLARTCFLAKKPFTPPKAVQDSEPRIHWRKRAKQRGRAFGTPTPWLVLNRQHPFWCPRQGFKPH